MPSGVVPQAMLYGSVLHKIFQKVRLHCLTDYQAGAVGDFGAASLARLEAEVLGDYLEELFCAGTHSCLSENPSSPPGLTHPPGITDGAADQELQRHRAGLQVSASHTGH